MAEYTPYKRLELPITIERYNVSVFNKNYQVIDSELNKLDIKNKNQDDSLSFETERATTRESDLQNAIDMENNRALSAEQNIINIINNNRLVWEDKYTIEEINNMLMYYYNRESINSIIATDEEVNEMLKEFIDNVDDMIQSVLGKYIKSNNIVLNKM